MHLNLTDFFLRVTYLGAEWVLWLLVGLSFLSVTIMVERWVFFAVRRVNVDKLAGQIKAALQGGNLEEALSYVQNSKAIECVVIAAGLRELRRGAHAVSETMLSVKARERLRQERFLPVLGTLGSNSPFIGLLGTVLGIIKAAHDMNQAQAGQQGAANAVMAGVFEALVATAVGLFVAIPAVIAFNFFSRRVRGAIGRTDALAHMLLSMMKPDQPAASPPARQSKPVQVSDGR
jgi:biopolymer transport protein ExbB